MLARKSTFILIADISNAFLGYIALFFIAKYIGPGPYGIVMFAMGYVALLTLYGDLGFDSAHIKYISSGENQAKCTGVYFTVECVLIVVDVLVVLMSLIIWKALGHGFESPNEELVIYVILAATMLKSLTSPLLGVFTAEREMVKHRLSILAGTVFRLIGIIYIGIMHLSIFAFAYVFLVEAIAILSISSFFFFRDHTLARPTKKYFKMYASYATPMAFAVIFGVAVTSISPVLLQLCFSSMTVGYYSAAFRIVGVLGIFTGALGTLLFPTLSSLHSDGDLKGMGNLISESERYLSMISFPLVFCTMALSFPISAVMLAGWLPASAILQVLPLYLLFSSLEQPYSSHILGSSHPKIILNRMFISCCICVGLNLLLVPKTLFGTPLADLGGVGAAIALVASSLSGFIYCRIMSHKILPDKINKHLLFHFAAAGIMAVVMYFLSLRYFTTSQFSLVNWALLISFGLLYIAGYVSILVILREFTKKDLSLILYAMNIKKLYAYAKGEIKKK